MKNIKTLVTDILSLLSQGKRNEVPEESISAFSQKLSERIAERLNEEERQPILRLSNLGTRCDRQLWYRINEPEKAEPLPPEARLKFLYGDILEELMLWLAKVAGHEVKGEQDELSIGGVVGHRDAIIDGELVDVKSASSASFGKFNSGLVPSRDDFGYLTQLGAYRAASPDVAADTPAHFLVVDKTLGKLCLDTHSKSDIDYEKVIYEKKEMLKGKLPPRGYDDEPFGKSGNRALGVACSYCPFKKDCWSGMRTFLYSSGPEFLTVVKRVPDVHEV